MTLLAMSNFKNFLRISYYVLIKMFQCQNYEIYDFIMSMLYDQNLS